MSDQQPAGGMDATERDELKKLRAAAAAVAAENRRDNASEIYRIATTRVFLYGGDDIDRCAAEHAEATEELRAALVSSAEADLVHVCGIGADAARDIVRAVLGKKISSMFLAYGRQS